MTQKGFYYFQTTSRHGHLYTEHIVFNYIAYCSSNSVLWLITIVFAWWQNHMVDGITWYIIEYTYLGKLWPVAIRGRSGEEILVFRN